MLKKIFFAGVGALLMSASDKGCGPDGAGDPPPSVGVQVQNLYAESLFTVTVKSGGSEYRVFSDVRLDYNEKTVRGSFDRPDGPFVVELTGTSLGRVHSFPFEFTQAKDELQFVYSYDIAQGDFVAGYCWGVGVCNLR